MKNSLLFLSLLWISIPGFANSNTIVKVIYFHSNSDSLTPDSKAILDSLVLEINNDSIAYFKIKSLGFTDSTGIEQNNLTLSNRRAEAAYKYILTKTSKEKRKGEVIGYGSQNPVSSNTLPKGRALNRRTVLMLELIKVEYSKPLNDTLFVDGGAMVIFPPGTLPYSFGKIQFNSTFINDVFICATCGITTITSTGECLSTAGMLFVGATMENVPIDSLAGKDSIIVKIPAKNFDPRIELFTAQRDKNGNIAWKPLNITLKYDEKGSYYEFKTRNLGGHNLDRIAMDICLKADPFKIKTRFSNEKVFLTYNDNDLKSVIATKPKKRKEHSGTIVESKNPNIVTIFKKGKDYYSIQEPASKLMKRGNKHMYVIRKKYYRNAKKIDCEQAVQDVF